MSGVTWLSLTKESNMTSMPSWALVEAGYCYECGDNAAFLFTHSLVPELPTPTFSDGKLFLACVPCHMRFFRSVSSHISMELGDMVEHLKQMCPTVDVANYPYISELSMCYACGGPETSSNQLVEAHQQNDRTIIVQVHAGCRTLARCCMTSMPIQHRWHSYTEAERPSASAYVSMISFEGRDKCQACLDSILKDRGEDLDNDYFACNYCNSYRSNDLHNDIGGDSYCERCVDSYRCICDDCGDGYWDGSDHYCDSNDYDSESPIHDYGYKPQPFFFPPKERSNERLYFGIELEVESLRGERHDCAEHVQNSLGARAYLKYDGSLTNGFEIVTHPHTLEAFRKDFAFETFASFRKKGLRSWNTNTCGLHVHVSRDAFGIPYDNRTDNYDEHLQSRMRHELKFIKLIYDNQTQVCKLAGRTTGYAHFGDKGNLLAKVRSGGYDRHVAVNTENSETLEVRVFKGSLMPERVLGCIEFVHSGVEYTRNLKVTGKNHALSWLAYCGYVHTNQEQYPNLYALMLKTFNQERDIEPLNDDDND